MKKLEHQSKPTLTHMGLKIMTSCCVITAISTMPLCCKAFSVLLQGQNVNYFNWSTHKEFWSALLIWLIFFFTSNAVPDPFIYMDLGPAIQCILVAKMVFRTADSHYIIQLEQPWPGGYTTVLVIWFREMTIYNLSALEQGPEPLTAPRVPLLGLLTAHHNGHVRSVLPPSVCYATLK